MAVKNPEGSEIIRAGSAVVLFYPWKHRSGKIYWRWMWHDPETGKRCYGTRADKKNARQLARDKSVELSGGFTDLNALDPYQKRAIGRLLKADPSLSLVDDFLAWKAREVPQKPAGAAVDEFLAIKEANRGRSARNVSSLRQRLMPFAKHFGDRSLATITTPELEAFLRFNPKNGNRTRRNIRGSLVTFFIWAAKAGHLPKGETAAEALEVPIVKRQIPETWEPDQMAVMLANVQPQYLGWLAAAAFGGFRSDEIRPRSGGEKSPLDWSDFQWDRDIVIVRPETDKNGHRRVVPILPAMRSWLYPIRKERGPVCDAAPPTKIGRGAKTKEAETTRLGKLVGGWRKNALRHSWISYRAAEVGLALTAKAAGNSESEARKSYDDAKSEQEAAEWFSLTREGVAERLRNPALKSA